MLSDFDLDETRRTIFCNILFGLLNKKQQQQIDITTAKISPETRTKTIHEIKRLIVTVEEVNRYLQHV